VGFIQRSRAAGTPGGCDRKKKGATEGATKVAHPINITGGSAPGGLGRGAKRQQTHTKGHFAKEFWGGTSADGRTVLTIRKTVEKKREPWGERR